jgi:predicted NBD/HSP70 family sugar kinase
VKASGLRDLLGGSDSSGPVPRLVRLLGARGAMSPAQIARTSGMARSTISGVLAELRASGMVVEVRRTTSSHGVGRPTSFFALNPEAGTCVGIHLDFEGLQVLVADVSHSVLQESRIPLGVDYAPALAARSARDAVAAAYKRNGLSLRGVLGVGVSVSGPIAPDGRVQRASMIPRWAGKNIREVFEPVLGQPVFADNESNCAAIAEMTWGAAAGEDDFVLFKSDVGVGGAVVVHGRVLAGVAGGGGEFGHIPIDADGGMCRCGNRGCLELTASFLPALERASRSHRRPLKIEDLVALAKSGDAAAVRLVAETAERAGRGLGVIGAVLNPGLFVISGRGAYAGDLLLKPLVESYQRHFFIKRDDVPAALATRFVIGKFLANDSLLGAVGLVLRHRGRL